MVVVFLPERPARAVLPAANAVGRVQHLVGVQLDSSLAVVVSSVASEQQHSPLPVEIMQSILDDMELPAGWPRGCFKVLGQAGGGDGGQACEGAARAGAASPSDATVAVGLRGIQLLAALDDTPQSVHSLVLFSPPDPSRHYFLALDPIRLHFATERPSLTGRRPDASQAFGEGLQGAVDVMNAAHQVDELVQDAVRRYLDHELPLKEQAASAWSTGLQVRLCVQRAVSLASSALLQIFDGVLAPGLPPLKDVSAFFHQLSIRAHQARILSLQLSSLRRSIPASREMATARADYIGFYNTVWLVLNDLIVGQALGRLLLANDRLLADWLQCGIKTLTVDGPLGLLVWLDHWPAGLKLNTELSAFASSTLSALVVCWDTAVLRHLSDSLPTIIWLVSLSGFLGASAVVALASDLLSLATAHLYAAYLGSTVTYRWMAILLGGLFDVFRGKRRNVLRQRLDSTTYTVDQLLVGSVLFTTLVFLFPTVLAYYALVACARTAVIFAHASLETALACINHYPLFAIMLRIKSPSRLPGGVRVQPTGEPSVLRLRNKPLAMSALLKQHLLLAAQILSVHYSPLRLARAFVKGEAITPLSNLPRTDG